MNTSTAITQVTSNFAESRALRGTERHVTLSIPLILTMITVLGGIMRLHGMRLSLDYDEATLYWISHGSIQDVILQNGASNSAPPLFALLTHCVGLVSGAEFMLRLIPLAAGISAIPAIYVLARQFTNQVGALVASLLLALAPYQILYSHDVREYSLSVLLSIGTFGVFIWYQRKPTLWHAMVVAGMWAVALAAQYGELFLILACNLLWFRACWGRGVDRFPAIHLIAVNAAMLGVGLIDWVTALRYQLHAGGFASNSYLASQYLHGGVRSFPRFAFTHTAELVVYALSLWGLVAIPLFALALYRVAREGRSGEWIWVFLTIIPAGIILAAACLHLYPYGGERQDLILMPMLYVGAGVGAGMVPWDRKYVIAAVPIILLGVLGSTALVMRHDTGSEHENLAPVVQTWQSLMRPGDRTYIYPTAEPGFRYYNRHLPGSTMYFSANWRLGRQPGWIDGWGISTQPGVAQYRRVLRAPGRVWLVLSHISSQQAGAMVRYAKQTRRVRRVQVVGDASLYLVSVSGSA